MKPVCFLHIGTHKTGTTSLQIFLTANEQCLERNGIFIPRSGRYVPESGHYNLFWELAGDERFNSALGSWSDTVSEICSRNPPVVCLSCEDFIHLRRMPDALCRIRQELNSIGYEVRIVVYLRPQADCIESVYVELVKHGLDVAFRKYFGEIFLSDPNAVPKWWTYPFDYGEILDPFAKVFGADCMTVRPYRANRSSKYLIDDFISVVSRGNRIPGLDFSACRERHNPSLNFAQVVELSLANRRKSGVFAPSTSSIPDGHFMQGRFDPLDLRDLMRIHRRFRESNRVLREKYQVNIPTMTWRRMLRELLCSAGLNRGSAKRKKLLAQLDASEELPRAAVSG